VSGLYVSRVAWTGGVVDNPKSRDDVRRNPKERGARSEERSVGRADYIAAGRACRRELRRFLFLWIEASAGKQQGMEAQGKGSGMGVKGRIPVRATRA
jgi:hypothetical protein